VRTRSFSVLACVALAAASGTDAAAQAPIADYIGRPVYSEPGAGLQLPPECSVAPSWRSALGSSDLEVWVADCSGTAHAWLVRRSVIEVLGGNQARLRYQVLDDRAWPGETAGESTSVQCSSKARGEAGYVVVGAKWRSVGSGGKELRLAAASAAVRVDRAALRLVDVPTAVIDCVRFPAREAMMQRLQHESK
jgi:hypothetical protein